MEKRELGKIIYDINNENAFFIRSTGWSSPSYGFSYDKSISIKIMNAIKKSGIIDENDEELICVLADWESVAEGIFFTQSAVYARSPKSITKEFSVKYNQIKKMKYEIFDKLSRLTIFTMSGEVYYFTSPLWRVKNIKLFLEIAAELYDFDEEDHKRLENMKLKRVIISGSEVGGVVFGNVSNAGNMYGQDKFNTLRGHGFAAERANHLFDVVTGKDAKIAGDNNALNGADRIVNGVEIQSKYCNSGSKCISECFDENGFRYWNSNGEPMQIEVPSDKYEAAVQSMKNRISKGEVKGVTDPEEAKNIIRKGNFTYEQVKNIARAGTVESIAFDAVNGIIISTCAFGISTAVSFAVSVWNGESFEKSIKAAAFSGLRVGGITFITAVLGSQLSKAGLNSALVGSSETIVRLIGPKASAMLVNAFRSGANIYGAAAMKSAAKLLRGNIITGSVTVLVLSSADVLNIFRGRISGKQLFKNIVNTTSTVAGGTAGWIGGATAGAAIGSAVPVIGTAIGGVVGGIVGSVAAGAVSGKVSEKVVSVFIEDDVNEMIKIIEDEFQYLANEFLLTQSEAENVVERLKDNLNGSVLKDMFASSDRKGFARNLLIDYTEAEAMKREMINLPSDIDILNGIKEVFEEISDDMQEG